MKAETWLSDKEAVKLGLADRVDGDEVQQQEVIGQADLSALKDSGLRPAASPTLESLLGLHSLRDAVATAGGK